ncbi:MAG: NAD-dependent epimerase/dehydratase family protein [Chloroflexia bacterium]|nr:NAD-dependent epimerase/dehydratase family protein [Chloroflexia bacterium]
MRFGHRDILITGGAGFAGSNLAVWFKTRYPEVRVTALDNLKRRGSELNLGRLREHGVDFVHGDIRNPEDLRFEGRRFDLLLECSAEPSVLAGYGEAPDYLVNTNLLGTVNCLELARRTGADLIFLSTSRVYPVRALNAVATDEGESRFELAARQEQTGVSEHGGSERFTVDGVRSLYGATKLCSELLIQEYAAAYGLRFVVNRCGVLTGPWQMGKADQGVFTLWVAMHYFERELSYIGWGGTGKQVRDLLHIDDLAELLDVQLARFEALNGETFNVGGGRGRSLSLLETTRLCQEITGRTIPVRSVSENRPADLKWYVTDNRRVSDATGWEPRHDPRATLSAIHDWIRAEEPLVGHLWLG